MLTRPVAQSTEPWPELPLAAWANTYATLHLWTQIVGKVRMALSPPVNHFWHVTFYAGPRGLRTSRIPYGDRSFEVIFDFVDHNLLIVTSEGGVAMLPLQPRSVADFYHAFVSTLHELDIDAPIHTMPQELPHPVPFDQDTAHASYDPEYANRFWRILSTVDSIFQEFRGLFLGKCSPVHFFWGSFDLAVTRFSGRRAPERAGAGFLMREAYSHECSSAGWWPGGATMSGKVVNGPAFYSYMAPEPPGFAERRVRPEAAYYDRDVGEFLLMYDDVRRAPSPRETLLQFLQSTYAAGADLALWGRSMLEEPPAWATARRRDRARRESSGGAHAA